MSNWSPDEEGVLVRAVQRAPSVHNTQPWVLELHQRSALLFERGDVSLPHHDPTGRDRLISCGAALTNLVLAVRNLGWRTAVALFPDPTHPDHVVTVTAVSPQPPTETEAAWFAAIPRRRSHREPFASSPLDEDEIRALMAAADEPGVDVHRISGPEQAHAVAGLFEHAAGVLRHDSGYQRELAAWTVSGTEDPTGTGIPRLRLEGTGLFGGLVRPGGPAPDRYVLASRLQQECVLVVLTAEDGKRDHTVAGAVLERVWLTATSLGLGASVVTQPLHLREVRSGLAERLDLPGFPQALLRVGRTVDTPPAVPHRRPADLVRPHTDGGET
ncbi:MAG TPA: nitroreductase family protein [Pseudonocardiaceae bacterium]